jgi:ribosomal protein S27AE
VPAHIGIFLISVWAIVVVAIAAIDDTRRQLPLAEAILYWLGLTAVCAFNYIVFSFTTLYYVGYLLLVAYYVFALKAYFRHNRSRYYCGKCGMKMYHKGECPRCGAIND